MPEFIPSYIWSSALDFQEEGLQKINSHNNVMLELFLLACYVRVFCDYLTNPIEPNHSPSASVVVSDGQMLIP